MDLGDGLTILIHAYGDEAVLHVDVGDYRFAGWFGRDQSITHMTSSTAMQSPPMIANQVIMVTLFMQNGAPK